MSIETSRSDSITKAALAALALSLCLCAHGESAQPAAAPPAPVFILKAQRIFDGVSGTLRAGTTLVVQGERLVSIGNNSPAAAGAVRVDGLTRRPGDARCPGSRRRCRRRR